MLRNNITAGCVYHVRLTKRHLINTKDKEYRDKFVLIIGCDDNSFYGVVLINSKLGFPEEEQYELKCGIYTYLKHNSFINCSSIKSIDRKTITSGECKGELLQDDLRLIIDCIKSSKVVTNEDKRRYGLV